MLNFVKSRLAGKNFSQNKFNLTLNIVFSVLLILVLSQYFEVYGQNIPWDKQGIVLDVGPPGSWDCIGVGNPCVIFENDTFKMWHAGGDGNTVRIGYATSIDGATWNKDTIHSPVLNVGAPGEWDDEAVSWPSVVFVNGMYHMWYAGFPSDICYIGHATSPDGVNWDKDTANPVLEQGPAGSWDSYWVDTPFIIFENDKFHLWYSGGSGSDLVQIGYATATNPYGKNWTRYPANPVFSPTSGTWDWPRVECPSIAIYNNKLYMFYSGGTFEQHDIGFATSTDKVTWYKDPEPCLLRGPAGSWDDYDVFASYVIYDGNEYKMWYRGESSSTGEIKIGLAISLTLPVELTSFTATSQLGKVILNWATATEINNLGFEIERKILLNQNQGDWVRIAFVEGYGTTTEPKEYSYVDDISTIQATTLVYRLKQMDFLGTYEYSEEVFVENPAPVDYILYQNYPNPFNPSTTITFGIPLKTQVVLKVFNAVGEEVAQLYNGEKEAGRYTFEFNAAGLPSGIYFYQLQAGDFIQTKKMILMK